MFLIYLYGIFFFIVKVDKFWWLLLKFDLDFVIIFMIFVFGMVNSVFSKVLEKVMDLIKSIFISLSCKSFF